MSDQLPPIDPAPQAPPKPARNGASKGVKVVLFLSLAVNLLIVGVVSGAIFFHGPPDRDRAPELRDAGLGPLELVLNRSQREALKNELRDRTGDLRENRAAMRADIGRILAALRAEPFDAAGFEAVLADQRRTVLERQVIGQQALIGLVVAATPAERHDMADRIERGLRRFELRDRRPSDDVHDSRAGRERD